MKALIVTLTVAIAALTAAAAPEIRTEKLRSLPVTIYPNFDAQGTALVPLFNKLAKADDALVVSYVDAFKGAFRVADLGVTQGQVWIYVAGDVSLGQRYRKNIVGAHGIVFVPTNARKTDVRRAAEQVADEAKSLGVPLTVGLDDRDTASLATVADVARSGDAITICASSRLQGSTEAYRAQVGKVIRAAREANPRIKVELAVIAGRDPGARAKLLEMAGAAADLADRLAVYCENDPESLGSVDALVGLLRPQG